MSSLGAELYQALETGVLDGTEFSIPTVDEQLAFIKWQTLLSSRLHQPSTNQFLISIWMTGISSTSKRNLDREYLCGRHTLSISKSEALQGGVLTRF